MKLLRSMAIILLCASSVFAQEIKRPTKDADSGNAGCAGTRSASTSMPKAYDALGIATFSQLTGFGSDKSAGYSARNFSNWQASGVTYTGLTLNVNSASGGYLNNGPGGQACIKYSLNGGTSWTKIRCDSDDGGVGWTQITDSIVLATTQDLTKVQVEICAQGSKGNPLQEQNPGLDDIELYDLWTSGTYNAQGAGSGSGAGEVARDIVIPN